MVYVFCFVDERKGAEVEPDLEINDEHSLVINDN